jgi:uncharacterized RDD family membrane protein YckC
VSPIGPTRVGRLLDLPTGRTYRQDVPYVKVGRRFLAFLADWVLSVVWTFPFTQVVRSPGHVQYQLRNGRFLAVAAIWFVYYVAMETWVGGTVGKLLLGIRVVRADGSKPDLATSLKRTALRVVDGFPYVLPYLVGAIAVWSSPTKQRLGDRWANTYVVRTGMRGQPVGMPSTPPIPPTPPTPTMPPVPPPPPDPLPPE